MEDPAVIAAIGVYLACVGFVIHCNGQPRHGACWTIVAQVFSGVAVAILGIEERNALLFWFLILPAVVIVLSVLEIAVISEKESNHEPQ